MSNGDIIFILAMFYLLGIVTSIFLLSLFGKKMGMDYDEPKTYVNHDDWGSNAEAFFVFSLVWPLFWCVHFMVVITSFLINVTTKIFLLINKNKKV